MRLEMRYAFILFFYFCVPGAARPQPFLLISPNFSHLPSIACRRRQHHHPPTLHLTPRTRTKHTWNSRNRCRRAYRKRSDRVLRSLYNDLRTPFQAVEDRRGVRVRFPVWL